MRRVLAVALFLIAATLVSCGRTTVIKTSADECDPVRSLKTGTTDHALDVEGRERTYLLHLPEDYDGTKPIPVMFLFHGFGGDPKTLLDTTKMTDAADDHDFAVVAPQGAGLIPSWQFRERGGQPSPDITFTHDLLRKVEQEVCVDRDRVYAAGFSNGSVLTLALACETSRDFAAFAAVSGPYYEPRCADAPPRPILYFHGLKDVVVPYGGARKTVIGPLPGVTDTLVSWAEHDRCTRPAGRTRTSEHVLHYRWFGCTAGSAVESYVVTDGGHRWPGGVDVPTPGSSSRERNPNQGIMTREIDASKLIWDFVRMYRNGRLGP
jgi:polyhydroxybutyrate depolymerase